MLHNARASAFVIKACEVKETIEKLKLHKRDGGFMLSSDHFLFIYSLVNTHFHKNI